MVNAYYISDELGHQLLEEHTEATEFVEEEQALESTNMSSRSSNNNKSWIIQIVEVFSDERGSIMQILKVLSAFTFFGCIVGSLMPKNDSLTTTWYPFISSSIGYTYFLMWSVSFYPQVVLNYTRGSTIGLSQDFCLLNLIGCACYMIYNCAFFYSKTIQDQYHDKHNGNDNTVASNDVAFSINAFLLTFFTFSQILYYDFRRGRPSFWVMIVCVCFTLSIVLDYLLYSGDSDWLQFFYLLSYIKLFITFIKYLPQVVLNYRRKSTKGWTIWNIVLDISGGTLSLLQLICDSWNMGDWTGITGNPAKLGISLFSICFDLIFIFQHYCLYPHQDPKGIGNQKAHHYNSLP